MAIEQELGRRAVLFAGAALGVAWTSGGCTDDDEKPPDLPRVRYADTKLEAGFQKMYGYLSPEDRAMLDDEVIKRKDVLIHIIRGKLFSWESRGGSSILSPIAEQNRKKKKNRWCLLSLHPDVKGIPVLRNWDLVYDEQRAEEERVQSGIPNPIDVVLYHEIFGHILRLLRSPALYEAVATSTQRYNEFEDEARVIENRYRKHRGLRLFPMPPKGPTP